MTDDLPPLYIGYFDYCPRDFEDKFKEIMREYAKRAVDSEREACAYIAEGYPKYGESTAAEIRARSKT